MEMQRYMATYGISERDIARVAVKNKRNGLDHPATQVGAEVTVDDVMNSAVMAWPVKRLDVSPTSDGAVAMVLASDRVARRITDKPVWVQGVGWSLDTQYWTNRDLAYPTYLEKAAKMAYNMAESRNPERKSTSSNRMIHSTTKNSIT